ncbi:hypothetical protein HMPREF1572_00628 [Gardnerella vaginalis JCP7275]|nr:hypothetical protein HMPREF1572_00628 [Gardnerella vaginalis JCP7275]
MSRALLSLFVASATLLATFVIAPTYALSAGENAGEKVGTEKAEGAQSDSAKTDGENKQQTKQSESNNNTELNKKDTGSSDTLKNNNKESKPVEKQKPDSNNGVDKAKSTEAAVNKNVKNAPKKDASTGTANNGADRGANEEPQLPEECRKNKRYNTLATCYSINYSKVKLEKNYTKVEHILKPKIIIAGKSQKNFALPEGAWLELGHKDTVDKYAKDGYDLAFFKDNNKSYTAKSTNGVSNSDGYIRFFANKWLVAGTYYKFEVAIHYPGGSESKAKKIAIKLEEKYSPKVQPGDLTLSLYDFVNKQAGAAISDNKITIEPKSNSQGAGVTDKKDTYDSINKLFIDSRSKDKLGFIYHRMICHETGSDDNASYTLDSVNGLSLGTQTQFEHKENQNRTDENSENSAVYENDDYIERSQSWITGTPTKAGTFVCEVFALKPSELKIEEYISGAKFPKVKETSTMIKEFDERVKTNKDMKLLFDDPKQNIVEDKWTNKADIQQGIDWDYKSVTIEVKSSEPPKPTIGDNDLTLKVYPFNGSKTALTSDNNKISAILGMSLKPFVDATSAADSANKITLRVLCSKGEKKDSGSQPTQPSGSSQPAKPSQAEEPLEYKTWSSNLAELGLSVPADDNQNTCHSNKEGEKTCESVDPNKKVAARTDMEVSIKPTDVGNYQCVVFALKPKALTTFDDAINKLAQSGSLTPDSIKSALTTAKPTAFKENKDFAAFKLNIDSVSNFTLPHTGGQSWNLQLGILAALLVNLLAAGFVVSQSERGRKLILGRWRGLCNHV